MSYQQYPQSQGPRRGESNTLSIVGIVLGAVAFVFCPPGFGIAGLICGIVANTRQERLAMVAIGVSVAGLLVGMLLSYLVFNSGVIG